MNRRSALLTLSLLVTVVLFFHKPLFSSRHSFPWDFRGVQLPLITFLRDEFAQGRFALWNPYNYCGYPIYANIQACFFHPLILLAAFLSSRMSWESLPLLLEWAVVLQLWLAGLAAYRFFRELGIGAASAWTGAVMFQTGSYFASRAEHIDAMMAAAWMPLAWLAVWKLKGSPRLDWLAVLAAALGMSIWGGFPAATLAVFVSAVVLCALLIAFRFARPVAILSTLSGCVLGILLAAVPFIPTTQLTELSVAQYRADWLGTGGGLYWQSLVSLVLPNHYHIFDLSQFKGPWDPSFLYLYSSLGGLLLAIFALIARRHRTTGVFAALLLFALIWMLGDKTPVWRSLYPLLPEKVRIGIHPEYTYSIFSLTIAALAAIGLDALPVRGIIRWAIGILIAADLFWVGSGRPMNLEEVNSSARHAYIGNPRLVDEMQRYVMRDSPPARIDTAAGASLGWVYAAPVIGVSNANGISPMALENIIQMRLLLHDGSRAGWYYPIEHPDSPVLDLMNVRYVLAQPEDAPRFAPLSKFRHTASLPGAEVFENLSVLPRFFLVHQARTAGSLAEARALIERQEIDFRQAAITDRPVTLGAPSSPETLSVINYQPASLELAVQTSAAALLVMSETYHPGWQAWLDGKPAPIYQTDIAFRGVAIPAGAHSVRMEFRPAVLPISVGISLATAAFLLLSAFLYRRRNAAALCYRKDERRPIRE